MEDENRELGNKNLDYSLISDACDVIAAHELAARKIGILSSQDIADFFILGSLFAPATKVYVPFEGRVYTTTVSPEYTDERNVSELQIRSRMYRVGEKVRDASFFAMAFEISNRNIDPILDIEHPIYEESNAILRRLMRELRPDKSDEFYDAIGCDDEVELSIFAGFLHDFLAKGDYNPEKGDYFKTVTNGDFIRLAQNILRYPQWKTIAGKIAELDFALNHSSDSIKFINLTNEMFALQHSTDSLLSKAASDPITARAVFECHSKQTTLNGTKLLMNFCSEGLLDELTKGRLKLIAKEHGLSNFELSTSDQVDSILSVIKDSLIDPTDILESFLVTTNGDVRKEIFDYIAENEIDLFAIIKNKTLYRAKIASIT